LSEINKTIASNNEQIQSITNASVDATSDGIRFVSYRTKTYRAENKEALKQKAIYLEKIDALDTEYAAAMKIYQSALHDYELKTKQSGINWFIDQMTLWYSLILVFILQLVNARFAYHGSTLLGAIKSGKVKDPVGEFVAETEQGLEDKFHKLWNGLTKLPTHGDMDEWLANNSEKPTGPGYDDFHVKPDKPWPKPEPIESPEEDTDEITEEDTEIQGTDSRGTDAVPPEPETPEPVEDDLSYDEKELANKVQHHEPEPKPEIISPKKDELLINTTEEVTHKETDLFTISLSEFLAKFKVQGLGEKSINKFCTMFNLKTTSDLNKFIKTVDYKKIVPRKFPKITSDRFIKLLTNIEGRWDNERRKHME